MIKPYVIGIAGESGVGKSTISEIICAYYGIENVLVLSTDDLHKWCRNEKEWDEYTHLNSEANNLELGDIHLNELIKGNSIFRSVYNHKHGYFDAPKKIEPKKIIVIEGLHSFYTDESKNNIDKKIYVETEESLRIHWKLIRDIAQRSGKKKKILETIEKRKKDAEDIKNKQYHSSDIVINLFSTNQIKDLGNKDENVDISCVISKKTDDECQLFEFIKKYIHEFSKFIDVSEMFGKNIDFVQDGGGNLSVKIDDNIMLIKSSGIELKNIRSLGGYSIVKYDNIDQIISVNQKKPSMEVKMHVCLKKYVIHLHPIYALSILCMKESKEIIKFLFEGKVDYSHYDVVAPGEELFEKIKADNQKEVYFFDNHGITVSKDSFDDAIALAKWINDVCKDFFVTKNVDLFDKKTQAITESAPRLFPDSVLFNFDKKETHLVNSYVFGLDKKLGYVRLFSTSFIDKISNLEDEKYRKTL